MKRISYLLGSIFFTMLVSSCEEKAISPKEPDIGGETNIVSQFVYDGMSFYYHWADQIQNKKPSAADSDPIKYFYSLRSTADSKHGWSWITNDVKGLLSGFSGETVDFGYNLKFIQPNDDKIFAGIKYVFPNTPAAKAGIKRLHMIGEINGQPITTEVRNGATVISRKDILALMGQNPAAYTLYKFQENKIIKDKVVTIIPKKIETNPILKDSVYNIAGKKIGYLFYTSFFDNYNKDLYRVFSKFKQENVSELILDLRYNHGGSISAALYLSSLIAPKAALEQRKLLTELTFNETLKKQWGRQQYRLGTNIVGDPSPANANLNLKRVYIIATGDSYSASELTTFCLKSHMEVVHIGNKTGGKYTASVTIHPYNKSLGATVYSLEDHTKKENLKLQNWAMQPIIAIYTNDKGQTFADTDGLIPDYNITEGYGQFKNWKDLGDTNDAFISKALYLITGDPKYNAVQPVMTRAKSSSFINASTSLADDIMKNSVILK